VRPFAALNSHSDNPSVDEAPILHIDLDAFFASVEILDNPSLKGKPVVVGGPGERGAVASASYEARRFGVKSAMPMVIAKRMCPNLVILPGRFDRYEAYSHDFHDIIMDLTPEFEPLGLDEVFADLRSLRRLNVQPIAAGHELRRRINDELGLLCGVGLGRNKLFAKLASKKSKPTVVDGKLVDGPGVVWVSPEMEKKWISELPVSALWGVGPATTAKLERIGIRWVRDLHKFEESLLARHVGPWMAGTLVNYANGEDEREVVSDHITKSIGHDETFIKSLNGIGELLEEAKSHSAILSRAIRAKGWVARTVSVSVRFDDFSSIGRSQTISFGIDDERAIFLIAKALLESMEYPFAIRLLGIHLSSFLPRSRNDMQLTFGIDTAVDERQQTIEATRDRQIGYEALRDAIDDVREKFGKSAVGTASELSEDGIEIERQRGGTSQGPLAKPEQ
jgi:DNA polymerase IV